MAEILFSSVKTTFKLKNQGKVRLWLELITKSEGEEIASLQYIFCTDNFLLALNNNYLGHDTLTDIISFQYSKGGPIDGEIYISIPRVKENAKKFNQSFDRELRRVMAHGLLHFFGYQDKTKSQNAQMRLKEEACLSLWK